MTHPASQHLGSTCHRSASRPLAETLDPVPYYRVRDESDRGHDTHEGDIEEGMTQIGLSVIDKHSEMQWATRRTGAQAAMSHIDASPPA